LTKDNKCVNISVQYNVNEVKIPMVTLHIHKPSREITSWGPFASQEDLFARSEMICSYLQGTGTLPKDITLDLFSGDSPFLLLSPKNYAWKKHTPVYLFTYHADTVETSEPGTLVWALHVMESQQVPVFLFPLPPGKEQQEHKPGMYRNVEFLERMIPSLNHQGPLMLLPHGKTFYEILLLLLRDRSRQEQIIPESTQIISLFGGDALNCSKEMIPDRKELREFMQELSDRISVIALTSDRRVPAAKIIRSWMDRKGTVLADVDLIKPAFPAREGIFPPYEIPAEETGGVEASVLQKTRYQMQLRLEVSHMICQLLTAHTRKQQQKTQA